MHIHGDDTERGAVFRDAEGDVPLSRRPKEFLEFDDDGTVRRLATGADDRTKEIARATWKVDKGAVVFGFDAAGDQPASEFRIVEQSPDRLIIHRR